MVSSARVDDGVIVRGVSVHAKEGVKVAGAVHDGESDGEGGHSADVHMKGHQGLLHVPGDQPVHA